MKLVEEFKVNATSQMQIRIEIPLFVIFVQKWQNAVLGKILKIIMLCFLATNNGFSSVTRTRDFCYYVI